MKTENKNSGKLPIHILLSRLGGGYGKPFNHCGEQQYMNAVVVDVIVIHRHMCLSVCVSGVRVCVRNVSQTK